MPIGTAPRTIQEHGREALNSESERLRCTGGGAAGKPRVMLLKSSKKHSRWRGIRSQAKRVERTVAVAGEKGPREAVTSTNAALT